MKTVTFIPEHIALKVNASEEFHEGVCKGSTIGISIRHPDDPLLFCLDDGWMTFIFDDITTPVNGLVMFTTDMAQRITSVCKYYEHIVVHCSAGMSRSAAVAKWLSDNKGYELVMHPEGVGTDKHYNKHVYNTLDACVGKNMAAYYENLERVMQ